MPHTAQPLSAAVGGVLALGLLALTGCAASAPTIDLVPFADRSADEFYPGDCFSVTDIDNPALVPSDRIPCDTAHNLEIVGLLPEFDATPIPADGLEFDEQVFPKCFEFIEASIDGALVDLPLVPSYTGTLAADNVTIDGPVLCTLLTRNGDILEDSAFLVPPRELLGEWTLLTELEAGTCFTLKAQNNIGRPAECESGTLMYLGFVEAAQDDEFPGTESLRRQRDEGCAELIPDDDRIASGTLSGTVPGEGDWRRGVRALTCDVEVI